MPSFLDRYYMKQGKPEMAAKQDTASLYDTPPAPVEPFTIGMAFVPRESGAVAPEPEIEPLGDSPVGRDFARLQVVANVKAQDAMVVYVPALEFGPLGAKAILKPLLRYTEFSQSLGHEDPAVARIARIQKILQDQQRATDDAAYTARRSLAWFPRLFVEITNPYEAFAAACLRGQKRRYSEEFQIGFSKGLAAGLTRRAPVSGYFLGLDLRGPRQYVAEMRIVDDLKKPTWVGRVPCFRWFKTLETLQQGDQVKAGEILGYDTPLSEQEQKDFAKLAHERQWDAIIGSGVLFHTRPQAEFAYENWFIEQCVKLGGSYYAPWSLVHDALNLMDLLVFGDDKNVDMVWDLREAMVKGWDEETLSFIAPVLTMSAANDLNWSFPGPVQASFDAGVS